MDDTSAFLKARAFAVAGASKRRDKYGNKVLRCYLQHKKEVYAVHPLEKEIEGVACYRALADLPAQVEALSIITPPQVTETLVQDAHARGIRHIWMQPGAESPKAIAFCTQKGINLIAGGACLLVVLGYHEGPA